MFPTLLVRLCEIIVALVWVYLSGMRKDNLAGLYILEI